MILIGSNAAASNGIPLRHSSKLEKVDWDFVTTPDHFENFVRKNLEKDFTVKESVKYSGKFSAKNDQYKLEIDATSNESNRILMSLYNEEVASKFINLPIRGIVASTNILYLTKRSHANYPIHAEKTLFDLYRLKKHIKTFSETEKLYYEARRKEAKERYGHMKDKINLNVPNEKFFDQSKHVRKFNHDDLHRIFAYHDKPIFEMVKRDMSKAKIEKDMFDALTEEDQLNMIREESAVIGFERVFIPFSETGDLKAIYRSGYIKFVKDLSKGWCQDFAIDNIEKLIEPNVDFMSKYWAAKEKLL